MIMEVLPTISGINKKNVIPMSPETKTGEECVTEIPVFLRERTGMRIGRIEELRVE